MTSPEYPVHDRIRSVFEALNVGRVNWVLLRGEERMAKPTGDIDLLVAEGDLEKVDQVLVQSGFLRISNEILATRRAYIAFVDEDNLWLRFDVVTRAAFGPLLEFDTDTAAQLLSARQAVPPFTLLDDNDAFWHLLLHYMLDRGAVPTAWQAILAARSINASTDGPLAKFIDSLSVANANSTDVLAATRRGDWSIISSQFEKLRSEWERSMSPRQRSRSSLRQTLHRVGLDRRTSFRPGVSVAILGPDGAGKTTLARGIADSFAVPTRYIYFGLWKDGRLERALARVPGLALALVLLRLVVRTLRTWYYLWRGCVVVLDRFAYDAMLVTKDESWKNRFTSFLILHLSATPDLVIVLDLPGAVAFERKGEQSVELMNEWSEIYRGIGDQVKRLIVLDATEPILDVQRNATDAIWKEIQRRVTPGSIRSE